MRAGVDDRQAMLAGGIGGTTGDMLMHSLDTVKTRQQGDPHMPPKYTSMGNTYYTIWRQEGFRKGLYGGVQPAFLGSFAGTVCFFGAYEWSKRTMIDCGIAPSVSYFAAGTASLVPPTGTTTSNTPQACSPISLPLPPMCRPRY